MATITEDLGFPKIPEEINSLFRQLDATSDEDKRKVLGIDKNRFRLLIDILQGRLKLGIDIKYDQKLDIQLYAWKKLYPNVMKSAFIKEHWYSNGKFGDWEYDPAKNGQNIIKHGISFGEVGSYSREFGKLTVPCPDNSDNYRYVVFGEISDSLKFPLDSFKDRDKLLVMSIITDRVDKVRFFSSRIMSENESKRIKDIQNDLKNIYSDNKSKKEELVTECIKILNTSSIITDK